MIETRIFGSTAAILALLLIAGGLASAQDKDPALYVGSKACADCHLDEYESFEQYCKKTHSFQSVMVMKKGLTDEEFDACLECHTTGHGRPGGFVSLEETPHLAEAGCEVCHGPGGRHVESEDAADIKGSLTPEDCVTCHNAERVEAFNYKPLIFGGAH